MYYVSSLILDGLQKYVFFIITDENFETFEIYSVMIVIKKEFLLINYICSFF